MSSEAYSILVLVALLLLFYLLILRPARRSQNQTSTLQRNLEVGDDVVLSAGIFGTITSLDESRVHLEIAPGIVIQVARQVVVRRAEDLPDQQQDGVRLDPTREPDGTEDDHTDQPDQDDRPQAG